MNSLEKDGVILRVWRDEGKLDVKAIKNRLNKFEPAETY